jgi:hypothetical protein
MKLHNAALKISKVESTLINQTIGRNEIPLSYSITSFASVTGCGINIELRRLHICIKTPCKIEGNLKTIVNKLSTVGLVVKACRRGSNSRHENGWVFFNTASITFMGSHGDECQDYGSMGCDIMYFGWWRPGFRKDGGSKFLRSVGTQCHIPDRTLPRFYVRLCNKNIFCLRILGDESEYEVSPGRQK